MIRCASHLFSVIQNNLNYPSISSGLPWIYYRGDVDMAVIEHSVAEILLALFVLFDQLFKRDISSISQRNLGVSPPTSSGRIALHQIHLAQAWVCLLAVGE